jgi:multisubunit Na+/H+ antiporter MnhB subunit
MKKIKHISFALLLLICSTLLYAQDKPDNSGFGNIMRSNGRIYVVVAVLVTILLGLILYLVRLDRKISRLEKEA